MKRPIKYLLIALALIFALAVLLGPEIVEITETSQHKARRHESHRKIFETLDSLDQPCRSKVMDDCKDSWPKKSQYSPSYSLDDTVLCITERARACLEGRRTVPITPESAK